MYLCVLLYSEAAICQAAGDPHYTIWDGGRVHYQGICTHVLCKTCPGADLPEGMPKFEVRWAVHFVMLIWTEIYIYHSINV